MKGRVEGVVESEFGSLPHLTQSAGRPLSNETVKITEPTYGLVINTAEGTYTISIYDVRGKPISALEYAIDPGDSVRFTYDNSMRMELYPDRIGSIPSTSIELLSK